MKFRIHLYLSLIILSILTISFALVILTTTTSKALFLAWQSQVASVAATTASQIDGNVLKQIRKKEDMGSPAYNQILQILRKARDANRRDDFYIRYFYTEWPDPENPNMLVFGVDAEEDPKDMPQIGDPDIGGMESFVLDHLDEVYVSNTIVKDQWGEWLVGSAPVYDDQGKYAGTVGAAVSAEIIYNYSRKLILLAIPSFVTCLILASFLAAVLSHKISAALRLIHSATQEIAKGHLDYRIELKTDDEFSVVADGINHISQGLAEQQVFKTGVSHYVPKPILDKLSDPKQQIKVEGERRKITVLFADIRGFTSFAEGADPETVVSLLNEYFSAMLKIIDKHHGTLDKLIGDGIMAEFGVTADAQNQEVNAVKAAIEMQQELALLRGKWTKKNLPPLQCGIGINTGEAVVGSIGSKHQRLEYTAIGDAVNTAANLEQYTKKTSHHILVSETTFQALNNQFRSIPLDPIVLAGKETPITPYAIEVAVNSI